MTSAAPHLFLRASAALVVGLALVSGCSKQGVSSVDGSAPITVGGVGVLPASLPSVPTAADPSPLGAVTVSLPHSPSGQVGSRVRGNKVILIGDSVMTSISHRYGDQACSELVPLGWRVEVDAETGRFIEFGNKVLDKRLGAGWDAAVVLLGNNFLFDKAKYSDQLRMLLTRLAPRPTVLLNTTMFRPAQANVNKAIVAEASAFDNVTVVDWASITEESRLTGPDGLHLTEGGRSKLAKTIAMVLGPVSGAGADCLKSDFKDDSMGSPTGPNGSTDTKPSTSTADSGATTDGSSPSTTSTKATTPPSSSAPTSSSAKPPTTSG